MNNNKWDPGEEYSKQKKQLIAKVLRAWLAQRKQEGRTIRNQCMVQLAAYQVGFYKPLSRLWLLGSKIQLEGFEQKNDVL